MRKLWLTTVFILGAGAWAAEDDQALRTVPVDEAARLVQAGLGEDVLLAWAAALEPYASVSADTIIKLKDAKVPEKVIAALVRRGGAAQRAAADDVLISRYEVPAARTSRQAETRREYTRDDAVRYTYAEPTRAYYADTPVYYSSYGYRPYYYSSYGYPSYYRWSYPRYYGCGYGSYYWPSSYFSGNGYWGGRSCRW